MSLKGWSYRRENYCMSLKGWSYRRGNYCISLKGWSYRRGNYCMSLKGWSYRRGNYCMSLKGWSYRRRNYCMSLKGWSYRRGNYCMSLKGWNKISYFLFSFYSCMIYIPVEIIPVRTIRMAAKKRMLSVVTAPLTWDQSVVTMAHVKWLTGTRMKYNVVVSLVTDLWIKVLWSVRLVSYLDPLAFLLRMTWIIWLSNVWTLNVTDEGYSRNASSTLN